MKRKILFVDDEAMVLKGLRRMLHGMRQEWDMMFVVSGREALQLMSQQPFDVIITDMRMPEMDGVTLLTEVKNRHPDVVRVVLSGYADTEYILQSVKVAHQFLTKPCDAEILKNTVNRACALQSFLADPALKRLIARLDSLPSLPETYHQLLQELRSEDASVQRVAKIISRDTGMVAKILQIVNSAFFGLKREVNNPTLAVNLLGLENIKSLVLTIEIFQKFENLQADMSVIQNQFRHSLQVGRIAREVAKFAEMDKKEMDTLFLAGMLHDIGKLVLLANLPDKYAEVLRRSSDKKASIQEVENQVLGATHAQVGAYLLGLWGIPNSVVEAVAFHHRPGELGVSGIHPALLTHISNGMALALNDEAKTLEEADLDWGTIDAQQLRPRALEWFEQISQQTLTE